MNISILCSDCQHPVHPWLIKWRARHNNHDVKIRDRVADLDGGHILFLISCSEFVPAEIRAKYEATLLVHASDLPKGRGWSPLIWQILEGKRKIAVTLLEAADEIDTGKIWAQRWLHFEGTELYDEINAALFAAELDLMDFAVQNLGNAQPRPQEQHGATYYPRRTPRDSRVDPKRSLAEQFDLLRVADPDRYPAFFEYRGQTYEIRITRKQK